jgi:putative membrane protein
VEDFAQAVNLRVRCAATAYIRERMKPFFYHVFCGLVMGTADLIPGVSGGTMAWILGVYPRLVAAIDVLKAPFVKLLLRGKVVQAAGQLDWWLMIPLGLGVLLAIVVMVKIIGLPHLVKTYPEYVYSLFFGLILGSIPLLLRGSVRPAYGFAWLGLGVCLGVGMTQLVPVGLPDSPAYFFLVGAIAISAMLLPGVSGSLILLILGKYVPVLDAIDGLDFGVLIPFVAGCIVGIVSFAKLLHWLLERYYAAMVWLMAGLLAGTLPKVWPLQGADDSLTILHELNWVELILLVALSVVGYVAARGLNQINVKRPICSTY